MQPFVDSMRQRAGALHFRRTFQGVLDGDAKLVPREDLRLVELVVPRLVAQTAAICVDLQEAQ